MKLELIKEEKIGENPFYMIYVDNKYATGSGNKEKIEKFYEEILIDPTKVFIKEVLRTDEIVVPLEENK